MTLESILFDAGDTLIDVSSWSTGADDAVFNYLSSKHQLNRQYFDAEFNSAMAKVKRLREGDPHLDKIAAASRELCKSLDLHAGADKELESCMKEFRLNRISLLGNAKIVLEGLVKKYDLYVISNARSENIKSFLTKLSIKDFFKGIFISEDFGARKEDGELFRIFLDKTGLNPKSCIMVGNCPDTDGKSMSVGIPFCFLDVKGKGTSFPYTFRIGNIMELNNVAAFFEKDIEKKCHLCKKIVKNKIVCRECGGIVIGRILGNATNIESLEDLVRFIGLDREQVIGKLLLGPLLVRDDWLEAWPTTEQEIDAFYAENTNYVFDLTIANMQEDWKEQTDVIVDYAVACGYESILDYGCGIAQPLLELAKAGKKVTGIDISDQNLKYVKERFLSRNLDISLSKEISDMKYDLIICTDVLEHLINPIEVMKLLLSHINESGAFAFTLKIHRGDDYMHPMHLSSNIGAEDKIKRVLAEEGFVRETGVMSPRGLEIWRKGEG